MRARLIILLLSLCGLVFSPAVDGMQLDDWARVRGKISGNDGAPIEGAAIEITNLDTGRVYTAATRKKGQFAFNRVLSGSYSYVITKEGYMTFTGEFNVARKGRKILELSLAEETRQEVLVLKRAVDLYNEGIELSKAGQYEAAVAKLEESIALDPERGETHHNLGAVYLELDRANDAEIAFLGALEADPELKPAREALAGLYSRQGNDLVEDGQFDAAFDILNEAYSFDPDHAHVNYLLGVLHVKRGEEQKAVQRFEKYLELQPDSEQAGEVKSALEKLEGSE